ncbi:Serine threonine kinase [Zea mays]|uniref:Serine threonine kinase n=1 Tax=Zea mays TaxID=4577 RepID=A0A1D6NT95_MAIZE|nr:Serine threonine kinase [Zea mays]
MLLHPQRHQLQGRGAGRARRGQVHHRVLGAGGRGEARPRRHDEGRLRPVQGGHPDHHLQGRPRLLLGVHRQQGEGLVAAQLHPRRAAGVAAPVADPVVADCRNAQARAAAVAPVVLVVERPRARRDAAGGQLPLAVRARGPREHAQVQHRPPERRPPPGDPAADVQRLRGQLRPQLRDVTHAQQVGRRLLRRHGPHHLLAEQQLFLLLPRHAGRRGGGDEEASPGAQADNGHVQHGLQGGADGETEGHGAAAVEDGGGAEDARLADNGGLRDGDDRAGEGSGEGGHGGGGGVAADRGDGGPEADQRGEEAAQGGRGAQEPRRQRHVPRGPVPALQHRGDRAGDGQLQRRAQGGRGRVRPRVQGLPRPHAGGHQGAPARRGAGPVAVPAGGGGAELHPAPQHGAPPRRVPGVRLPRVRVHGQRQPGRLPVPALRRRRRARHPVAAPVPHLRRDRDGAAVPAPDQARAAGAPGPQAGEHPAGPQLREQDQRRRAGAARAAVRRRHRDAVPDDVHRGDLLLHRPGVPADGHARRQVRRLLLRRHAAADHHGEAAHGAVAPRRTRPGARRAAGHAGPRRARLAPGGGAVPRRDGAPVLRAAPQGPAGPRRRRAPGAQPAARARRGQHAVLRRHHQGWRRRRRHAQLVAVPQQHLTVTRRDDDRFPVPKISVQLKSGRFAHAAEKVERLTGMKWTFISSIGDGVVVMSCAGA